MKEQVAQAISTARADGDRGALLPALHAVQATFGHIPDEAIGLLAEHFNLSRADVHGVMTFYRDFRREPAGRTRVLSTGGMLAAARTTTAESVLVATETGMLHQLRQANPAVRWEPVNPGAVCRFMKMTTPASLLRCLRAGVQEVTVPASVASRARRAVQAMITAGDSPAAAAGRAAR